MTNHPREDGLLEAEDVIRDETERRAARRRFDEGFAEYEQRREEEELDRIEEEELDAEEGQ